MILAGCAAPPMTTELTFLTREGCAATQTMLANLKQALGAAPSAPQLQVVDLDTLPREDVRRGYPTPTLPVNNVDAFGLPQPSPPIPEPTRRFYPDGVPSSDVITTTLSSLTR